MEKIPIRKDEIIGKHIKNVFEIDLPYDAKEKWQQRIIVVELESGLKLSLEQQPKIVDLASNMAFVYPFSDPLIAGPVRKALPSGMIVSRFKDAVTGRVTVPRKFNESGSPIIYSVITPSEDPHLGSPIQTLALGFGYLCSLILENNFVLFEGFSDWDNGVMFYECGLSDRSDFTPFNLPV